MSKTGNTHEQEDFLHVQPPWKGSCLTAAMSSLEAHFCGDLFSCKSIVKEVNIAFVLIGVKWLELSWKIATILNYQVKI